MNPSVLIIEDDKRIAELVAKNLGAAGFRCQQVHDGESALRTLSDQVPSLVLLDIMLPGIDGYELTRRIRRLSNVPILMLTARTSDSDKVLGFELGADDYLTKPFSTQELVARARALLRRASSTAQEAALVHGNLRIDPARREVMRDETLVETTSLEFDLLHFLASRPGVVYSREALMERVWGHDRIVDTRSIDSLISRLRRKLEQDPAKPRYIQTVWGAGYRFREQTS